MHLSLIFSQFAVCEHVKPPSFLQVEEQPSPSLVLPSSHSSLIKRPSPHSEVQPVPVHLGSVWHVEEQPSNGTALPSSQLSAPSFFPSPHFVGEQVLGWPSHLKPTSNLQLAEQPSPAVVLPSSHCSEEPTILSPQITSSWHGLPGGLHEKPGWVAKQLPRQPSLSLRLPSSQASSSSSLPSPQFIGAGVEGLQGEPGAVGSQSMFRPAPLPPLPSKMNPLPPLAVEPPLLSTFRTPLVVFPPPVLHAGTPERKAILSPQSQMTR